VIVLLFIIEPLQMFKSFYSYIHDHVNANRFLSLLSRKIHGKNPI